MPSGIQIKPQEASCLKTASINDSLIWAAKEKEGTIQYQRQTGAIIWPMPTKRITLWRDQK